MALSKPSTSKVSTDSTKSDKYNASSTVAFEMKTTVTGGQHPVTTMRMFMQQTAYCGDSNQFKMCGEVNGNGMNVCYGPGKHEIRVFSREHVFGQTTHAHAQSSGKQSQVTSAPNLDSSDKDDPLTSGSEEFDLWQNSWTPSPEDSWPFCTDTQDLEFH